MKQKNYHKTVSGFTLIELLIVIVIIGLLGSLVGPKMFSKVDSSKRDTALAQMRMFSTALDTYRLDVGKYPEELSELTSSNAQGWDGPYLPTSVPLDPWNTPYQYSISKSSIRGYVIQSLGSDGKVGGEDGGADVVLPE